MMHLQMYASDTDEQGIALPPKEPPPPTSRKRVLSMDSARMNGMAYEVVREVSSVKDPGVLNPNTGFPEPLSPDRNTTLPHPDADVSKNATIEAADIPLSRTHSRRGFLRHQSHKSVTSKGKIDPAEWGTADHLEYIDGSKGSQIGVDVSEKTAGQNDEVMAPTTTGAATEASEGSSDEAVVVSIDTEQAHQEPKRKRSLLRKLHK